MGKLDWKQVREKIGATQAEMAEKLGISQQAYGMKERYERQFTVAEAIVVAKMAGVELEDIKLN